MVPYIDVQAGDVCQTRKQDIRRHIKKLVQPIVFAESFYKMTHLSRRL